MPASDITQLLIVFDSNSGNTYRMAQQIARGVNAVGGCEAVLRSVPKVSANTEISAPAVPDSGAPYVHLNQLAQCHGLILGTPTHFGNMTASMKHFLDQTTNDWFAGTLAGKPAAAFTSTGTQHGGQESTLLSMMLPLLHHGMLITGIPFTEAALNRTQSGGSPYGASHVSGESGQAALTEDEITLCQALGSRVADTAQRLRTTAPTDPQATLQADQQTIQQAVKPAHKPADSAP